MYVIAFKGYGNESGMFDVTKVCFTSPFQSSIALSVCLWESCLRKRLEVVSAILLEQLMLGPAFCFGEEDERMPEEQV